MGRVDICIPTHNRYPYLLWTLARLQHDFPLSQIIVSDNASWDGTRYLWSDSLKIIRQKENIGAFPNMVATLRAASADYAVYCADDDYLIPERVSEGIAYLDAHPTVAAYCAPCEVWDEVAGKPYRNAFHVEHPRLYTKGDGVDLFNFLIEGHVWPEHFIYRVPVAIGSRTRAYWAFADIPSLLDAGGVYFAQAPFYRNLLNHPVGVREQLGNVQCLTMFDEYRAGLEVLAQGLFGDNLPYRLRHQLQDMIQSFICTRMAVARQIYLSLGDELNAQMLERRLAIADPCRDKLEIAA